MTRITVKTLVINLFCLICHDFISAGKDDIVIPNSSSSVAEEDENSNSKGSADPDAGAGALLGGSSVPNGSGDITNMVDDNVDNTVVDDNVDDMVVDDNVADNVDHKIDEHVNDSDSD